METVTPITALTEPQRYPDEITAILADRIAAGVYPIGTKLPSTRELALAFHVSPPIVREALSRLKYDGLVAPRQGSGVFVSAHRPTQSMRLPALDADHAGLLADTFELRIHVEQICAELAAQRRTDDDMARLRLERDAMARAVAERSDGTAHDVAFHLAIAAAAHNTALLKLAEYLYDALVDSVRVARRHSAAVPGNAEAAQSEHDDVFAAIEASDPIRARRAVHRHLSCAATRLGLTR